VLFRTGNGVTINKKINAKRQMLAVA